MQDVLSNTTKVVIDQKQNSNLLFLPLDKLMQAAAVGTEVTSSPGRSDLGGSGPPAASNENRRTRDAFRSRNREAR